MSNTDLATLILLGGFIVLMLLRVPIAFTMLLPALGAAAVSGTNLTALVNAMIDGVSSFTLLAIPFFLLMGEMMGAGKISERIVALANLIVGPVTADAMYVTVQKEVADRMAALPDHEDYGTLSILMAATGHVHFLRKLPASVFWPAENYHQAYYEKKGSQPYCHFYTKRF